MDLRLEILQQAPASDCLYPLFSRSRLLDFRLVDQQLGLQFQFDAMAMVPLPLWLKRRFFVVSGLRPSLRQIRCYSIQLLVVSRKEIHELLWIATFLYHSLCRQPSPPVVCWTKKKVACSSDEEESALSSSHFLP